MAYEPLIQKEAPKEPAAPDPNAALLEARLAQARAEMQAEMQAQINAAYQANKGIQPQVQYVPYPVQQEAEDPELSEAEILADLPGAIDRRAQQIAEERERALREELGSHLSRIYEESFETKVKDLGSQPYYKFVEKELTDYFKEHPDEKYTPGRLQEKYNALVGSKISEIRAAEAADEEPARVRAVDHPIPVSSSHAPASAQQKVEEVNLTPEEEAARLKWNKSYGLNMSPEEWAGIRDGELLPGNDPEGGEL